MASTLWWLLFLASSSTLMIVADRDVSSITFAGQACDDQITPKLYTSPSPGTVDTLEQCVELCEVSGDCESITFYELSKWCTHFYTACESLEPGHGATTVTPEVNPYWTLVGNGKECEGQYLDSSGKQDTLKRCIASCDLAADCKSVTFFTSSQFCSHYNTACEKYKNKGKANAISMTKRTQLSKCDMNAGEVFRKESSGEVSDLAACKKSCEDDAKCKGITFFTQSKYCSHFSTGCTKRTPTTNTIAMTLKTGKWTQDAPTGCDTKSGTPGAVRCSTSSCDSNTKPKPRQCPKNADCANKCPNGSTSKRVCASCNAGFMINTEQTKCSDVNECLQNNGGCDSKRKCTNTVGSFKCEDCPAGYANDGAKGCKDVNECATNNGGCDSKRKCINRVGSMSCGDCPAGYANDGAKGCKDVNECATNNGGCDSKRKCINTVGSMSCGDCAAGYTNDGAKGCKANVCACDNGVPMIGTGCPKQGAAMCKECNAGFIMNSDKSKCKAWAPKSNEEFKAAINECLKRAPTDCSKGPHGPIGSWDVSTVTDMSRTFNSATSFNGDISKWDVSSVTNMYAMFAGANSFNGDISKWDVSSVTDMYGMFNSAFSFNGDLSKWDVSRVTNMGYMFYQAKLFKGDISKWVVSSVTKMHGMFMFNPSFNGDLSKWDVSKVIAMQDMFNTASSFTGDLSKWVVSSVTNMRKMFYKASLFNSDLSKWDVSSVDNMQDMFRSAELFDSDISKWDVSSVENINYMFIDAKAFSQTLCDKWKLSPASKSNMFAGSKGKMCSENVCRCENGAPVTGTACTSNGASMCKGCNAGFTINSRKTKCAAHVCACDNGFPTTGTACPKDGAAMCKGCNIGFTINVGKKKCECKAKQTFKTKCGANICACDNGVPMAGTACTKHGAAICKECNTGFTINSDKSKCIAWAPKSNTEVRNAIQKCAHIWYYDCTTGPRGPIGSWDVTTVTDMSYAFDSSNVFDGDISKWDVSGVTNMYRMFSRAQVFNSDLSDWVVSSVTNMQGVFVLALSFNSDLSKWDVSKVTDMKDMFNNAKSFNGDLSKWDVSKVTNMYYMFNSAISFNDGGLSKWDVSRVANMGAMFIFAYAFNGDLSNWDVSSVTNMGSMFYGTKSFNGDLSSWDVSSVTSMGSMFFQSESFNGDLSKWDVSSVEGMNHMFRQAKAFSQTLCGKWKLSAASKSNMFTNSKGKICSDE